MKTPKKQKGKILPRIGRICHLPKVGRILQLPISKRTTR